MTFALIIAGEMVLASAVTAVLYWIDKQAARNHLPRTSEKTLLLGCVVGGWPGGWVAGRMLRHKTYKRSYRIKFVIAVLIHLAAVGLIAWQGSQISALSFGNDPAMLSS